MLGLSTTIFRVPSPYIASTTNSARIERVVYGMERL
jgi:hypothetical protein